ncbi:hypothetical protein Avbf_07355 [Armadillidium vulgare]|nr:hypothetical protein Avbf_07355 [Armadillidium vulgare]
MTRCALIWLKPSPPAVFPEKRGSSLARQGLSHHLCNTWKQTTAKFGVPPVGRCTDSLSSLRTASHSTKAELSTFFLRCLGQRMKLYKKRAQIVFETSDSCHCKDVAKETHKTTSLFSKKRIKR